MAYVPPHKRSVKDDEEEEEEVQLASVVHKFDQQVKLSLGASGSRKEFSRTKCRGPYPGPLNTEDTISRLLPIGLIGDDEIPPSVELKRYYCDSYESRMGKKYFTLVNAQDSTVNEASVTALAKDPMVYIAEKIENDVLTSFENAKSLIENDGSGEIRSSVVVRLGKILFFGPPLNLDLVRSELLCGSFMGGVRKIFFTTVPDTYIQHLENKIARDGEFGSMIENEQYIIKIADKQRPGFVLACKCTEKDDGKLKLLKVETRSHRHLVVDMPLFVKPLDVRLVLDTKRKLVSLTSEAKDYIRKIVTAATIDPNVKGGLKWPPGKHSVAGRFRVQEFSHLKSKSYFSSIMRVRLRYADRFDYSTWAGEYGCEVTCKLTDLKRHLEEEEEEVGHDAELVETLKESLRFIWDNLLNCDA